MNHYEVLGVDRNATQDEIKKAFRRQAQAIHPDRDPDGDPDRMARLNKAYETLMDERRRADYDLTGNDGNPNPLEFRMHQKLMEIFASLLSSGLTDHFIKHAEAKIKLTIRESQGLQEQISLERAKVIALKKKVKLKNKNAKKQNAFHLLIDAQLEKIDKHIAAVTDDIVLLEGALVLLEDYDEEAGIPTPHSIGFRIP